MNDEELRDLLQADPAELSSLDASRVIAGAHRRRRTRGVVAASLASAAVVVVVAGGIYGTANQGGAEPFTPPIAGGPGVVPPKPSTPNRSVPKSAQHNPKYVFQNGPQTVGSLAPNGSVEVGVNLTFRTRGTRWALVSHVPGEDVYEPFGWRSTVGNDNIGDGTSPGIQSMGAGKAMLVNSVFKAPKVATVVYASGTKAWYGKIYRLGGIPGWVASSALVTPNAGNQTISAGKAVSPTPPDDEMSVFAYDGNGKLLASFGSADDPLAK